jgi:hypothetical protein
MAAIKKKQVAMFNGRERLNEIRAWFPQEPLVIFFILLPPPQFLEMKYN